MSFFDNWSTNSSPWYLDPSFYMGALGSGLGIYGVLNNNKIAQKNYDAQRAAALAWQQQIDAYNRAQADYMRMQNEAYGGYLGMVNEYINSPLNIDQFYQPLSEAAKTALLRGVKSNIAERGIQPGGYYDDLVAEALAKTEGDRYSQALDAASRYRSSGLQALLGAGPMRFVAPNVPINPYATGGVPQRAIPPSYGDLGAIGKWFQFQQERDAKARAERQQRWLYDELLRRTEGRGYTGEAPRSAGDENFRIPSPWGNGGFSLFPSTSDDNWYNGKTFSLYGDE